MKISNLPYKLFKYSNSLLYGNEVFREMKNNFKRNMGVLNTEFCSSTRQEERCVEFKSYFNQNIDSF
jgi:hypothetical protein